MFSYVEVRVIVEFSLFKLLTAYMCGCLLCHIIKRCSYCRVLINEPVIEVCKPKKHEYIICILRDWPVQDSLYPFMLHFHTLQMNYKAQKVHSICGIYTYLPCRKVDISKVFSGSSTYTGYVPVLCVNISKYHLNRQCSMCPIGH